MVFACRSTARTERDCAGYACTILIRVAASIEKIKAEWANQRGLLSEQFKLLNRKLDEIGDAAHRMGEKTG
jgi:hypothetical protein